MPRTKKQDGFRDAKGRWMVGVVNSNPNAGRPTRYNQTISAEFVERIKYRTTIEVCEDPDMPDRSTIYNWQKKYPEFCTLIEAAREDYADYLLETAQRAVDAAKPEDYKVADLKFKWAGWRAERVLNHRYGQKTKTAITGGDQGDEPFTITVRHIGSDSDV
jgi:hypothetical protein